MSRSLGVAVARHLPWVRGSRRAEALGAAAMAAAFLALAVWWVLYDNRTPGAADPGRHLLIIHQFADRMADFDLLEPLTFQSGDGFVYPPLVHTLAAIPVALGLPAYNAAPITLSLVFMPLLALGCYLTAQRVFGSPAGFLAAVFALAAPMVMQLFHVTLLDAPLAAMISMTVWAILASERFSRRRETILAGGLLGLALLVKTLAPVYVVGVVATALARGGWHNWRNVCLGVGVAMIVAGPYYAIHFEEYARLSGEAGIASQDPATLALGWTYEGLERFSPGSLAWYGWVGLNLQYLLPFSLLFAAGLVASLRRIPEHPLVVEMIAGLAVGYAAITLLAQHDPRYSLPLVVYVAAFATGWIGGARRSLATAGVLLLAAGVVLNVGASSLGVIGSAIVRLPGNPPADLLYRDAVVITDRNGYVVGEPRPDPLWYRIFDGMRREGLDHAYVRLFEAAPRYGTDVTALTALGADYGIYATNARDGPADVRISTWWSVGDFINVADDTSEEFWEEDRGLPPPCGTVEDGVRAPGREGVPLRIVVERRGPRGFERWCEF